MLQVVQTLAAVGIQTVEVTMNITAPADAAYNIILGEQGVITGIIMPGCSCMQVTPFSIILHLDVANLCLQVCTDCALC